MRNPTNHRNEPVCPICARAFTPGAAVVRVDEGGWMLLHAACGDDGDVRDEPRTSAA